MKTLLTIPLFLLSLISFPSWSETIDDLVKRDGIYYKKFSDAPFNGEVEGREQGKFKNGKREGSWVKYYDNGQLWFKGDYKNGKEEGPWVAYWRNGQLSFKGDYKDGRKEGRWVWYDEIGNPWKELSGVFKDGVKISD